MYLLWVLALINTFRLTAASEQHCIDPANCQFYPVHSCFATDAGLICRSRNMGGYEMSIDPLYTFFYTPWNTQNDTDLPCESIPITDELINYVDLRGPKVIDEGDLPLLGNCSRMSYCDAKTRTCQPKRSLGSKCQHNMECYFGIDGIPGHCGNNSICVIRDDLPAYYYGTTLHQWTVGEHLKAAILAVLITGIITTCLIMGRQQVSRMIAYVRSVIDRWRNKNTTAYESPPFESEEIWREYHKEWWKQVPGVNWVYSRLNRGNSGRFYELNNRGDTVDEPPPYHQN